ncbi:MAG: hypothetical protein CM1200mP34_1730 [Verrucomicrobiales bacterium]|nr:MAG: hypothetical protein CM1200mP34_1730 [Verrucomicrobiales bacterium]
MTMTPSDLAASRLHKTSRPSSAWPSGSTSIEARIGTPIDASVTP